MGAFQSDLVQKLLEITLNKIRTGLACRHLKINYEQWGFISNL